MIQKILVIGQAPPKQFQKVPYDTTMIYSWLQEVDVTKDEAQEIFDWEAVYDKFPGYDKGAHAVPTPEEMEYYWEMTLRDKVIDSRKIWVL